MMEKAILRVPPAGHEGNLSRSPEDTPFTSYQMEFAEVALQERGGVRQGKLER